MHHNRGSLARLSFINFSDSILYTIQIFKRGSSSWKFEEKDEEDDVGGEGPSETDIVDTGFPQEDGLEVTQAIWTNELQTKLESQADMTEFNHVPGIYAVVLGCIDKKFHMVSFAYLDCSALLLQGGTVSCRSPTREGITLDMKLDAPKELIPLSKAIPLEPLVLDIAR